MTQTRRAFIGIEGRAASPAEVFDAFVLESAEGPRRHFARIFEVVALPGEAPAEVRSGDLFLRRALGEGGLGSMTAVASPRLFGTAKLGRDQMLLRPREGAGPGESFFAEAAPAYAAAGFIRWLQTSLNQVAGTQLKVDGDFGSKTRKALQGFQSAHGLSPSGATGPRELASLLALGAAPPPGADGGSQKASWCEPAAERPDGLLGQIFFPTDRYDLDAGDVAALHKLVAAVQALPPDGRGTIKLLGLADHRGTEQHNLQLGQERATAVETYLKTRLGADPRLAIEPPVSLGEQPGNGDLAAQRRVDIVGAPIVAGWRPPVAGAAHLPPMRSGELERLPPRPALTSGEEVEIVETLLLAAGDPEGITVTLCSAEATVLDGGGSRQALAASSRVKTTTQAVENRSTFKAGNRLQTRVFPAPPQVIQVQRPQRPKLSNEERAKRLLPTTEGFLPKHLDSRSMPRPIEPDLRVSVLRVPPAPGQIALTTFFEPEDRLIFSDLSFPFCTTGRVQAPGGHGSGVLVGPRHVLTVSHAVPWKEDGSSNWIKFQPSYFDGPSTFGTANAIQVLFYDRVKGPLISASDQRVDYAVLVLDKRLGDVCGWMGSRGYSDSWDGLPIWSHIGYPQNPTKGERPTFENAISLDGSDSQSDNRERMDHKADVFPGQSGGPFYGWWREDPWPRVVAVQSGETPTENTASGGDDMVELIKKALKDFP